jgi:hypothetical protein
MTTTTSTEETATVVVIKKRNQHGGWITIDLPPCSGSSSCSKAPSTLPELVGAVNNKLNFDKLKTELERTEEFTASKFPTNTSATNALINHLVQFIIWTFERPTAGVSANRRFPGLFANWQVSDFYYFVLF